MRLDDVPRELLAAVAALAVLYVVVVLVRGSVRRARMRRRFVRAAEGEREAIELLEALGFVIEGYQVPGSYSLSVDGRSVEVRVCADYIVSRGGDRFVAEVKTGKLAPKIETAATRRQLLEYEHAFDVTGVLLVDADARTIRRVELARARAARSWGARSWGGWALAAVLLVLLLLARLAPETNGSGPIRSRSRAVSAHGASP